MAEANICLYTRSFFGKSILVVIVDTGELEPRYAIPGTHFAVSPELQRIASDRQGRQMAEFVYHHLAVKAQNTEAT